MEGGEKRILKERKVPVNLQPIDPGSRKGRE
jgi:hypothetical protein